MIVRATIADEDLHTFIDGELDRSRAREVAAAARTDPALLARIAAFQADKRCLAALYGPVADAPLPLSWLARIEAATTPARRRVPLLRHVIHWRLPTRFAFLSVVGVACLALIALTTGLSPPQGKSPGLMLVEAGAARRDELPAIVRLAGEELRNPAARDSALRGAVGLQLRAPDLSDLHWQLTELETYPGAAVLRYRNDTGHAMTIYVRSSMGPPRFAMLKDGAVRTCIWQDEVVGAVVMGDMSAGQMMRVASAAYLALNL
jgi:anti-sigma factor RsiW